MRSFQNTYETQINAQNNTTTETHKEPPNPHFNQPKTLNSNINHQLLQIKQNDEQQNNNHTFNERITLIEQQISKLTENQPKTKRLHENRNWWTTPSN